MISQTLRAFLYRSQLIVQPVLAAAFVAAEEFKLLLVNAGVGYVTHLLAAINTRFSDPDLTVEYFEETEEAE